MRLKFKSWAKDYIQEKDFFIKDANSLNIIIKKYDRLYLELGCGKGQFIYEKAKSDPTSLYIGIEKYESVIVVAGKKQEENKLDNLYFWSIDVLELVNYEALINNVNIIYLNFSDPWPKARHAKRRLTSEDFLNVYDNLLTKEGSIEFKTDNQGLFEYSLESFCKGGYNISNISLDLHNTDRENIKTEYEIKFSNKGFRINYLEARRRSNEK